MVRAHTAGPAHPPFIAGQVREYRYFFLNLTPSRQRGLTVACGGWELCAADYRIERSDFAFYGLEYVARGRGMLTLNGVDHELLPGSVFAYRPFTAHTIRSNPEDPMLKYFIDFSGREAEKVIGRKVLGIGRLAYLRQFRPIHDLYEQMLETGLKGGPQAPRVCSLLLELLSHRIEEYAHAPSEAQGRARQTFERAREELQAHFRTVQSVGELAERTHLDPAYLARLFDRFLGESPHEMLTRLKVTEAAALLTGGRSTVKEVAAHVGFADPYHFSRVFKKHLGISPGHFHGARAQADKAPSSGRRRRAPRSTRPV